MQKLNCPLCKFIQNVTQLELESHFRLIHYIMSADGIGFIFEVIKLKEQKDKATLRKKFVDQIKTDKFRVGYV